jgi:hypothetical protein
MYAMDTDAIFNKLISVAVLIIGMIVIMMLITTSHDAVTDSVDSDLRDENSFLGDAWTHVGAGTGENDGKKGIAPITVGLMALIAFIGLLIGAVKSIKNVK